MPLLDDAAVLALWEHGAHLHPLDRTLVLCAAARREVPAQGLADLPLGAVNRALLALRRDLYGARLRALTACERCAALFELDLDAGAMIAALDPAPAGAMSDPGFRAPTLRDLADVAGERDAAAATRALIARCGGGVDMSEAEFDRRLEAVDAAADIALEARCDACGHTWRAGFDVAAFVWAEVAAHAAALMADVHRLALAYGWTEAEILTLGASRRAAYLDLCSA